LSRVSDKKQRISRDCPAQVVGKDTGQDRKKYELISAALQPAPFAASIEAGVPDARFLTFPNANLASKTTVHLQLMWFAHQCRQQGYP